MLSRGKHKYMYHMNTYPSIVNKLQRQFFNFGERICLNRPLSVPRRHNFESKDFYFIELRSENMRAYFRVFDPMSKTTISKNQIVIELYNQRTTPHYFRGEVEQIDIERPDFLAFIKAFLDEKSGKPDISVYITKFAKKTYEMR